LAATQPAGGTDDGLAWNRRKVTSRTTSSLDTSVSSSRRLHRGQGQQPRQALIHYLHVSELYSALGDIYYQAHMLSSAGSALATLGRCHEARNRWREAAALFRDLGRLAEAAHVENLLDSAEPPVSPSR
jgi:hypothetical protein